MAAARGHGVLPLLSCLIALTAGQLLSGGLVWSAWASRHSRRAGVDFAISPSRYHQARADGEPHQQAIATSVAKRRAVFGAHDRSRFSRWCLVAR
jgi:hypothetical protein